MSALVEAQAAFMASILDEDAPLPNDARLRDGMAIYRTNYRARMIETLEDLYERTRAVAGEAVFRDAAIRHVVERPCTGWRIETAGSGFADTVREVCPERPDLAECAALEAQMNTSAHAADDAVATLEDLGAHTAHFTPEDWTALRLRFANSVALICVTHDLASWWSGQADAPPPPLDAPAHALVWREGEAPVFVLMPDAEAVMLSAMRDGAPYGEAVAPLIAAYGPHDGVARAGALLTEWIGEGLIVDFY